MMDFVFLWALAGLQIKHFVADYSLQWGSMIADKPHLNRPGGYIHAAIHIAGTLPVLLLCGLSLVTVAMLLAFEFVVHFLTDYIKARHGLVHKADAHTRSYWIAHGIDQLVHQLTYVIILLFMLLELPY